MVVPQFNESGEVRGKITPCLSGRGCCRTPANLGVRPDVLSRLSKSKPPFQSGGGATFAHHTCRPTFDARKTMHARRVARHIPFIQR